MHSNASYDQILSDFSSNWNNQSRNAICKLLEAGGADERFTLALSLLQTDIAKRLERGEQPQLDDYLTLASNFDLPLLDWHSICIQALSNTQSHPSQSTQSSTKQNDPSEITILNGTEPSIPKVDSSSPTHTENGRFGKYKLIRTLGKGGMGKVWLAEQLGPVSRFVAIKVALNSQIGEELQRRFQRERQALAILNHPNISNIFDAGTSVDGIPFFVMEFIDGKSITKFCDEQTFTLSERLTLFLSVCSAIQHAHQKGLIHRDLKPSNVLVSWKDGRPFAHVIDFGLVKSLGYTQHLDGSQSDTEYGTVMGTLQYMSPEQADMKPKNVDVRSDVYSLGALLYEILTGSTPLEHKLTQEQPYLEALQIVFAHEAVAPSRRIQQYDAIRSREVSKERKTNPKQLSLLLKGELDWIVMKTLEKEPARRYQTVNELAHDIQSYLNGDVVTARAPSVGYRARKFMMRHKVVLSSVALISLLALIPVLGMNWMMEREKERASQLELKSDQQEKRNEQQGIELAQSSAHANIQLALNQWAANQTFAANEYLYRVPEKHRKLTWGIAQRMLQGSIATGQFKADVNQDSTFSHNRQFAVLKSYRKFVVADVESGKQLASFPIEQTQNHFPSVPILVTNDGSICIQAVGNRLLLLSVLTQKKVREISLGMEKLSCVSLSYSEKRLALGTESGQVHVLDLVQLTAPPEVLESQTESSTTASVLESKARLLSLPSAPTQISHLQFQDGDSKLIVATTTGFEAYDLATSQSLWKVSQSLGFHNGAEYCPTGTRVFTSDLDGRVTVWDLVNPEGTTSFATGKGPIQSMDVSPNGLWIACVSEDQVIRLYDTNNGSILREYKGHMDSIGTVRFTADAELLISVATSGDFKVWPTPFHRGFPLLTALESKITYAIRAPKTQQILIGTEDGLILCWDSNREEVTKVLNEHVAPITCLALSSDGSQLASSSSDGMLVLWDLVNIQVKQRFKGHKDPIASVALDTKGDRMLSADEAGVIRFWNTETGKSKKVLQGTEEGSTKIEFNPVDSTFVVADDYGKIRIWSATTENCLSEWDHSEDGVVCLAISKDGKFLFTGGVAGEIHLWDLEAKNVIKTFSGHSDVVSDLVVNSAGDLLISSSADGSVRIWNITSGALDLQFPLGRFEGDYSVEITGVDLDEERNQVLAFTNTTLNFQELGLIMSWDANWQDRPSTGKLSDDNYSDASFHRFMLKATETQSESIGPYALLFHSAWCLKLDPTPRNYTRFRDYYEQWGLAENEAVDDVRRFLPEAAREALLIPASADLVPKHVALETADVVWNELTASKPDTKALLELSEVETLQRSANQYELEKIHRTLALLHYRTKNFSEAIKAAKTAIRIETDFSESLASEWKTLIILSLSLFQIGNKPMAAIYYNELQSVLDADIVEADPGLAKLLTELENTIPQSLLEEFPPAFSPASKDGFRGGTGGGGFF